MGGIEAVGKWSVSARNVTIAGISSSAFARLLCLRGEIQACTSHHCIRLSLSICQLLHARDSRRLSCVHAVSVRDRRRHDETNRKTSGGSED